MNSKVIVEILVHECVKGVGMTLSDSTHSDHAKGILPATPFSLGVLGEGDYPMEWYGDQPVELL